MSPAIAEPTTQSAAAAAAAPYTYVLITPARNEATFIERTLRSVVSQTRRPLKWVIVSDGSTDGTDSIVERYAAEHPWIELVRMPQRAERHFAGKVMAFNAGYDRVKGIAYDAIANLDADISFNPDYFEYLLHKLESDASLGLVGTPFRDTTMYDYRFVSTDHVSGACQVFRRACFEAIGGYQPSRRGGVDHIAVITARMKGWRTRTFLDKICEHHRPIGSADRGTLAAKFKIGVLDYALGGHPIWRLSRVAYQMTKPPYVVGGLLILAGYVVATVRQIERPVSKELVKFRHREQMARLRNFILGKNAPPATVGALVMTPAEAPAAVPHICVCICTYKRGAALAELLTALDHQHTAGGFTYSVVVADNDALQSAAATVTEFSARSPLRVSYCVEPRQNIALARNMAVAHAHGEFVAFIDDDEVPGEEWLLNLFSAYRQYGVDGVLGPVKPRFDEPPPKWFVEGRFCERPTYPTGFVIDWRKGRTGNVLLNKTLFDGLEQPFRPQFRTGEDQDFFRRMIDDGHTFVWCDEAVAYESVPSLRWKRTFMLRRALLRGAVSLAHPTIGAGAIAKSAVAAAAYASMLPFSLLFGQRGFMTCLIKLFDHGGRLLASVGIHPVKEPYVTE